MNFASTEGSVDNSLETRMPIQTWQYDGSKRNKLEWDATSLGSGNKEVLGFNKLRGHAKKGVPQEEVPFRTQDSRSRKRVAPKDI